MDTTTTLEKRPSHTTGLVAFATLVTVGLLIAAFPVTSVVGIPAILAITVHHAVAMARSTQGTAPFALLLGLDMIALTLATYMVAIH